jgi:hypothetical protein
VRKGGWTGSPAATTAGVDGRAAPGVVTAGTAGGVTAGGVTRGDVAVASSEMMSPGGVASPAKTCGTIGAFATCGTEMMLFIGT